MELSKFEEEEFNDDFLQTSLCLQTKRMKMEDYEFENEISLKYEETETRKVSILQIILRVIFNSKLFDLFLDRTS